MLKVLFSRASHALILFISTNFPKINMLKMGRLFCLHKFRKHDENLTTHLKACVRPRASCDLARGDISRSVLLAI